MPSKTLHGIIHTDIPKAIRFESGGKIEWLPKSQITINEISHMRSVPRQVSIEAPEWLLKSKGFD